MDSLPFSSYAAVNSHTNFRFPQLIIKADPDLLHTKYVFPPLYGMRLKKGGNSLTQTKWFQFAVKIFWFQENSVITQSLAFQVRSSFTYSLLSLPLFFFLFIPSLFFKRDELESVSNLEKTLSTDLVRLTQTSGFQPLRFTFLEENKWYDFKSRWGRALLFKPVTLLYFFLGKKKRI